MEKKRILLVDDQKDLLGVIKKIIEKISDYSVETASSGKQALELAREKTPDLIILDLIMPQMDGFAVLQELKSDVILSHVPVIILSGRGDEAAKERALELYNELYLTKPVTGLELKQKIDEVLKIRNREGKI